MGPLGARGPPVWGRLSPALGTPAAALFAAAFRWLLCLLPLCLLPPLPAASVSLQAAARSAAGAPQQPAAAACSPGAFLHRGFWGPPAFQQVGPALHLRVLGGPPARQCLSTGVSEGPLSAAVSGAPQTAEEEGSPRGPPPGSLKLLFPELQTAGEVGLVNPSGVWGLLRCGVTVAAGPLGVVLQSSACASMTETRFADLAEVREGLAGFCWFLFAAASETASSCAG